jgi:hypothetical protein
MRSLVAVVLGVVIAAIVFLIGAVIADLNRFDIAQGSQGRPPATADFIAYLAGAAAGAFCGTALAVRVARRSPGWHAGAVTLVLAMISILGYRTAESGWPSWFGFAMAAAWAIGALAAALSPGAATTNG